MTADRYQRIIVWMAVFYLYMVMLLVAITFATSQTRTVEILLSGDSNIILSPMHFSAMSFVATISAAAQLLPFSRKVRPFRRRAWYVATAFPLLLYTVPVAQMAYRQHASGIGVIVYLVVYFSFLVIAGATFRPKYVS